MSACLEVSMIINKNCVRQEGYMTKEKPQGMYNMIMPWEGKNYISMQWHRVPQEKEWRKTITKYCTTCWIL